ncbi:hypothetical protein Tco_0204082 [Tanacetum coccineum]
MGKALSLTAYSGTYGNLHRRSELVEHIGLSIGSSFKYLSKKLLVLNKIKQTMLDLKVVRGSSHKDKRNGERKE